MTQQTDDSPVSSELDAMVCDLLGDFLDSLADGVDPGAMLAVEDIHGNRYQAAFDEDGAQELDRYAIAYCGAVELDGGFEDAVLVSFYQRGMDSGYSAYTLYRGFGTGDSFMWSDPEPAGEEQPLL